jgi:hypothetical protein
MRYSKIAKTIRKFTKEEILQTIDFSRTTENEVLSASVFVFDLDSKKNISASALDDEMQTVDDNKVSFFLTSDIPEGDYILQVLAQTEDEKIMSEGKILVRSFFIA